MADKKHAPFWDKPPDTVQEMLSAMQAKEKEIARLTAPLTKAEARQAAAGLSDRYPAIPWGDYHWRAFVGKTPEYVALMLRMDGYTSVEDSDVLKACGRI